MLRVAQKGRGVGAVPERRPRTVSVVAELSCRQGIHASQIPIGDSAPPHQLLDRVFVLWTQ
jgi:hypothetical protein